MNDFTSDEEEARKIRDLILVPLFYEHRYRGRYVLLDNGLAADFLQQRFKVDTIVRLGRSSFVAIEEKIVRWKGYHYTAFFLETKSCTVGCETPGWMLTCQADWLLYCFRQKDDTGLICHLVDFTELCNWFWPLEDDFPKHREEEKGRALGRIVQIFDIVAAGIPTYRGVLNMPPTRSDLTFKRCRAEY